MEDIDPKDYWTTADVARYLGIRPGTVRAYAERGSMPAPFHIGRTLAWKPDVIKEWRPRE